MTSVSLTVTELAVSGEVAFLTKKSTTTAQMVTASVGRTIIGPLTLTLNSNSFIAECVPLRSILC